MGGAGLGRVQAAAALPRPRHRPRGLAAAATGAARTAPPPPSTDQVLLERLVERGGVVTVLGGEGPEGPVAEGGGGGEGGLPPRGQNAALQLGPHLAPSVRSHYLLPSSNCLPL